MKGNTIMKEDLVSIIIPAYNVSRYISRGIESCINQTYEKIEIIVVDDGSTDNTWDIISGWGKTDNRIKTVQQENSGVSAGRNVGLESAQGEYVLFLDGDDWLEQDTIEYLLSIKGGREDVIVTCGHYNVRFELGELKRYNHKIKQLPIFVSTDEVLKSLSSPKYSMSSACYKLYPKHIIKNLYFATDIYNMEDGLFVFQAVSRSAGIIYSTEPKWNILFREDSFTRSGYNAKKLTAIKAIERMIDYNKNPNIYPVLIGIFFLRALQLLNEALLNPYKNEEDIIYLRRKLHIYTDSGVFYVKKFTTFLNSFLILYLPIKISYGYRKTVEFIRNRKAK